MQQDILGHRDRGGDPLYGAPGLLGMTKERLNNETSAEITRLLEAGDPDGEAANTWQAKESVRELYTYSNPGTRQRPPRCAHQ